MSARDRSLEVDAEDDDYDATHAVPHGNPRRKPKLRKADLPMIAAALRRRYFGSGGGGIPR
jgi:hypothetical protein